MTREEILSGLESMAASEGLYDDKHPGKKALLLGEAINLIKEDSEKGNVNFFGLTLEAERRIMKNALRLIRIIVDDYVFGCDSGSDEWRDFFTGWSDELDDKVEKAERPSDFCYKLPSDEWLFKELISWGTTRGGHGSACEECAKIGKILKGEEYDD